MKCLHCGQEIPVVALTYLVRGIQQGAAPCGVIVADSNDPAISTINTLEPISYLAYGYSPLPVGPI